MPSAPPQTKHNHCSNGAVLYIGIGMAALVWLVALVVIVRTCMRQRRQAAGSSDRQGTQGATRPVSQRGGAVMLSVHAAPQ